MLWKRIVYGRPNAVTSSFSPLRPCVLNSDSKYFNLSITHLEVTHIPKIVILAYFLTKLWAKEEVKKNGGGIHSSLRLTYGDGGS